MKDSEEDRLQPEVERLEKEREDEIDVEFEFFPSDPEERQRLWYAVLSGAVAGVVAGVVLLIVQWLLP